MKRLNISLIALAAVLGAPAIAQDIVLDEIVISANRTKTEAKRAGVSVSVVAKADLDRAGVAVVETLARQPGFSTAAQGPFGNTANLTLRGAQGRYVAVFVDGIRVDDPSSTTTSYEFGGLMSSGIDRIEVLRGSQSALWGGSAVAGVVSIDSPRATEDGTQQTIEIEAGSMGTAKLGYGLTQKTGALELTLNASHLQTDGFSAAASGTEDDGAKAQRLSFGLRYAVTDALTLGANAFVQKVDQDYDGFARVPPYAATDADNSQKRDELGARVFAELSSGATDHVFSLSTFKIGRDYFAGAAADGSFEGTRQRLDWTATTEISPALTLVYGADLTREGATVNSVDPLTFATTTVVETTTTKGVFAQGLWAMRDDLDLSATLRWDDTDSFGGFTTGRVAMAWRPADDLTLRAAYATGFRAPSLNELYADYSAYGYANNPALQPETSTSAEIGVEKAFGNGATLSATLFKLDIDNLIGNRCTVALAPNGSCPSFSYILDNFAGTSQRKGLELAASLPLGDTMDLSLTYAYIDAKTASNTRINGVARHNLTLGLDKEFTDRLSASATMRHVAGRTDIFSGAAMQDVTTVDLGVSYKVSDTASAYLRVQNAFDARYQEATDYATAGRAVFVGLKASF